MEDKDTRVQETWLYARVRAKSYRSWSDRTAFIAMVIEALNR